MTSFQQKSFSVGRVKDFIKHVSTPTMNISLYLVICQKHTSNVSVMSNVNVVPNPSFDKNYIGTQWYYSGTATSNAAVSTGGVDDGGYYRVIDTGPVANTDLGVAIYPANSLELNSNSSYVISAYIRAGGTKPYSIYNYDGVYGQTAVLYDISPTNVNHQSVTTISAPTLTDQWQRVAYGVVTNINGGNTTIWLSPGFKIQESGSNTHTFEIDRFQIEEGTVLTDWKDYVGTASGNTGDTPIDCTSSKVDAWRNLIGGKKITGSDMCPAVPRINWSNGTIYTAYTDTGNTMYENNFYVMTGDHSVFKCIENASGANSTISPNTVGPTFSSSSKLTDGYVWKYMYTLSTNDREKFLNDAWLPVRTLTLDDGSNQWKVQSNASPGGIESIIVTGGGVGYTNAANVVITTTGSGSGLVGTGFVNTVSQTVTNVVVTSPGIDYYYANATISGGGGSGATVRPVISPLGGHGSNPVDELGASHLIINILINNTEGSKIGVQNDFRQIVLLKNPTNYDTGVLFSNGVFNQTTILTLSSGGSGRNYVSDEYVYQGDSLSNSTFAGMVLDWDYNNSVMGLVRTSGNLTFSGLTGYTSGESRFVIDVDYPDLTPYSGDVEYIDTMDECIRRANNQSENIQIVYKF